KRQWGKPDAGPMTPEQRPHELARPNQPGPEGARRQARYSRHAYRRGVPDGTPGGRLDARADPEELSPAGLRRYSGSAALRCGSAEAGEGLPAPRVTHGEVPGER